MTDNPKPPAPSPCQPFSRSQTVFATGPSAALPPLDITPPEEAPGKTAENLAVKSAANTLCQLVSQSFYGKLNPEADSSDSDTKPSAAMLQTPGENSARVKRAAMRFGAGQVGITELDRRWLYAEAADSVPDALQWVVVMAMPMDAQAIAHSPGSTASAATRIGYLDMAICAGALSCFIREFGFSAIASGNDTALSIPLARDAGLGEMGRSGMLIVPSLGPCVRLCKVFTDMPLTPDAASDLGVVKRCRSCKRCVEACPAGAIDGRPEPTCDTLGPFNSPGISRWPVHAQKCRQAWGELPGGNCTNCIASCPYMPRPKP